VGTTHDEETTPEEDERDVEPDRIRGILFVHPLERFVPLVQGKLTFGRDARCSVHLEGPLVSRQHASVRRTGQSFVLCDEGSRNGTRKNSEPVSEVALENEDIVRIGDWVGIVLELPRRFAQAEQLFAEPVPGVLIGPRTTDVWQRALALAPSRVPVLITAPTGCGKEVFSEALHRASGRKGPFLAQNCAALPDALVETQLFGHTRGAFTGASSSSPGMFVEADGGTLLLDEVAELPLPHQAKLLRAIEERAVAPVGSSRIRPVDVRLVAASQLPLRIYVEQGRFRADLLARLSGATLTIPSLAERREEVPLFFRRFLGAAGGDPARVQPTLVEALCLLGWPFNVRELKLLAETLVALFPNGPLGTSQLEEAQQNNTSPFTPDRRGHEPLGNRAASNPSSNAGLDALGRRRAAWLGRHREQASAVENAVQRNGGNVSAAARELGISQQRARRLITALEQLRGAVLDSATPPRR
jgi:DNA-binding NtrC family response regulator